MATSPHQPESLSDQITRLKAELASYRNARDQILAIGQSSSGGGTSVNYAELACLESQISWRQAQIASLIAQLNGTADIQPGVGLLAYRGETPYIASAPAGS